MFAHDAVQPKSVFSPARPPMPMRYEQTEAAKRTTKNVKACGASQDITTILDTDELDAVMVAVWQTCTSAPMYAAVSRQFKRATEEAEQTSKDHAVAPPRAKMEISSVPSIIPSVEDDTAVMGSTVCEAVPPPPTGLSTSLTIMPDLIGCICVVCFVILPPLSHKYVVLLMAKELGTPTSNFCAPAVKHDLALITTAR